MAKYIKTSDGIFVFEGNKAIVLPKGSDGERPNPPQIGMIRYNVGTNLLEVYTGTDWGVVTVTSGGGIGGGAFVQRVGDTMLGQLKIVPGDSFSPGLAFDADSDTGIYSVADGEINFSSNGDLVFSINSDEITAGSPTNTTNLKIYGSLSVNGSSSNLLELNGTNVFNDVEIKFKQNNIDYWSLRKDTSHNLSLVVDGASSAELVKFDRSTRTTLFRKISKVAINSVSVPTENLYVSGNTKITGNLVVSGKFFAHSDSEFNSTSYLKIPVGSTAQRPSSPTDGYIRFNTTNNAYEFFGNSQWKKVLLSGDTVVSAGISGGAGIFVTGSPITSAGTINISLTQTGVIPGTYTRLTVDSYGRVTSGTTASLSNLDPPTANFSFAGFKLTNLGTPTAATDAATKAYVDSFGGTVTSVAISGGAGISVTGSPITSTGTVNISLTQTGVTAGTYTRFTVDSYGRITSATSASLSNLDPPTANFSFAGFKLTNLGTPTAATDAATKGYVDGLVAGAGTVTSVAISGGAGISVTGSPITSSGTVNISLTQTGVTAGTYTRFTVDSYGRITSATSASLSNLDPPTANFSFAGYKLTNLGTPTAATDAATKGYVDGLVAGAGTVTSVAISGGAGISVTGSPITSSGTVNISLTQTGVTAGTYTRLTVDSYGRVTSGTTASLSDLNSPTANFSFAGYKLINLGTPTAATDAATKGYVDSLTINSDNHTATTGENIYIIKLGSNIIAAFSYANIPAANLGTFDSINLSTIFPSGLKPGLNFSSFANQITFRTTSDFKFENFSTGNLVFRIDSKDQLILDKNNNTTIIDSELQVNDKAEFFDEVNFNSVSHIKLPVGNNAQRPAVPNAGMMRFNTDSEKMEFYDGTGWKELRTSMDSISVGVSPEFDIPNDGNVTYTVSALTSSPALFFAFAVCKVSSGGYSVGDKILLAHQTDFDEAGSPERDFFATWVKGNTIGFTAKGNVRAPNKNGTTQLNLTSPNFKLIFKWIA